MLQEAHKINGQKTATCLCNNYVPESLHCKNRTAFLESTMYYKQYSRKFDNLYVWNHAIKKLLEKKQQT